MQLMFQVTVIILFLLGSYGLLTRKNMIQLSICLNIMEASLLIFLVSLGFREDGSYPIVREGVEIYVDPLPQALTLTAIVIGASLTAVILAFIIKVYKRYNTLDVTKIRKLKN
ncbi:MAG: sodium:proton antiporter [bacterium]